MQKEVQGAGGCTKKSDDPMTRRRSSRIIECATGSSSSLSFSTTALFLSISAMDYSDAMKVASVYSPCILFSIEGAIKVLRECHMVASGIVSKSNLVTRCRMFCV